MREALLRSALLGFCFLLSSCQSPQQRLERHIAVRLALAPHIAWAKWQKQLPIHDPQREQALLQQVKSQAAALGLPQQQVEQFFISQIQASKAVQQQCYQQWQTGTPLPSGTAPDLQSDLRPKLDALTQQLLQALSDLPAESWPKP